MAVIKSIVARQIYDSRGNPTVEVKQLSFSVAFLRIRLCDLRSVKALYIYFFLSWLSMISCTLELELRSEVCLLL
jgi:hypothetical protein